jgi:Zn finger protein HypA/HybF involved in hydrogenase expression
MSFRLFRAWWRQVIETLESYPGARVKEVRLRVGALSAVVEDSFTVLL